MQAAVGKDIKSFWFAVLCEVWWILTQEKNDSREEGLRTEGGFSLILCSFCFLACVFVRRVNVLFMNASLDLLGANVHGIFFSPARWRERTSCQVGLIINGTMRLRKYGGGLNS